jgi:hypothetical protein
VVGLQDLVHVCRLLGLVDGVDEIQIVLRWLRRFGVVDIYDAHSTEDPFGDLGVVVVFDPSFGAGV